MRFQIGHRQFFALSRTLRIRQAFGLNLSTDYSISPLPTVLDYRQTLSDFHEISRAGSCVAPSAAIGYRPSSIQCSLHQAFVARLASSYARNNPIFGEGRSILHKRKTMLI